MLKKFISYYKPYKKLFVTDMLCALGLALADISIPLFITHMLNTVYETNNISFIISETIKVCLALLVLYIFRMFCTYYVNSYGHIMGSKMESDMRYDLFKKLSNLPFSYYDRSNTGQMISRLINDLFAVTELAHHGPEDLFISFLKLTGAFIILWQTNNILTITLMVMVVFIFIFSKNFNRRMKGDLYESRIKVGNINQSSQDSLAGIRVVQSFANEGVERKKFRKGNMDFLNAKRKFYTTMGIYTGVNGFMQGIMYILVFSVGGYGIVTGYMEPPEIILFLLYIGMFLEPVNKLINFVELYQNGATGFERMLEVLEEKSDITDSENPVPMNPNFEKISFKDVTFKYEQGEGNVLEKINFDIHRGKTIALVGPSGGGKTTFCSLLPRFYDVSNGSILFDNVDIKEIELKSLRQNIGVVQQDVYIFGSTIKENIQYGKMDATMEEIVEAAKKANIHDFIMSLEDGYDSYLGERGVRFSGGQKQRISIARVFLKNPPILILDEATAALDNESERFIQQSLEELSKNRTTIVIAHRLSTIRNADTILVLTDAGIVEKGTHEELINIDGKYSKLYNMQFEGL